MESIAKKRDGRGRPATGRRWTHSFNLHLDADTYQIMQERKPTEVSQTKWINDLIRKEATL